MWFSEHPITVVVSTAAALVIVGALIVSSRTPEKSPSYAVTWGGAGGLYAPGVAARATGTEKESPALPISLNAPFQYPVPFSSQVAISPQEQPADAETYERILSALAPSFFSVSDEEAGASIEEVFSLIPQGLRSISEPKQKSAEEYALYRYGNELGSIIQSHEGAYGASSVTILKDFYADRTHPEKREGARRLGRSITRVGDAIIAMSSTPEGTIGMHALLAESYQDAGKKLEEIVDATSDEALLERIEAYNKAADDLATAFGTLAVFFSTAHVSFSASDPGSVFVFSPVTAL